MSEIKVTYTHVDPDTGKQFVVEAGNVAEAQKKIEAEKSKSAKAEAEKSKSAKAEAEPKKESKSTEKTTNNQ